MKKQSVKKSVPRAPRNFFDTPDHPYFHLVNGILTFTIIASITAAVLKTVDSLTPYRLLFATEAIGTGLFGTLLLLTGIMGWKSIKGAR